MNRMNDQDERCPEMNAGQKRYRQSRPERKGETGMSEVDPKLLEMAEVFHIPKKARMKYIILPAKMPGLSRLVNRKGQEKGNGKPQKGGSHR